MAALPKLVRANQQVFTAATWTLMMPLVPAGRAQVGRLILANNTVAQVIASAGVNSTAAGAGYFAVSIPLAVGAQFDQPGVVLEAGVGIVVWVNTTNGITATWFGEEVDN